MLKSRYVAEFHHDGGTSAVIVPCGEALGAA